MYEPGLNLGLPDDVAALRETVGRFARERVAPCAAVFDRDGGFPRALWREMGELGLLGITVEEDWGGAAMGYLAHVVALEEISRASASVALSYGAHSNLCVNQIRRHGTPEQKGRHLPGLVSGEAVGALAMSEAEAGSDVVSMRLAARRCNDGYVLNGNKMWITNGPDADCLVVYAKTDSEAGSRGITAFIVEREFRGFSSGAPLSKLGMRGSRTSELVFDDCRVPFDNVLGEENGGIAVLMSGLDYERIVLAGGPLGIMAACLDTVVPYVHHRRQFDRPIGTFQLVQAKLADMLTTLSACRAYVYAVAAAADRGETSREDAAGCILYASERATAMALDAIQLLGGNGYIEEFPAGRLLRDAKLYEIGAGTSEIRRMLIGRELFARTAP
ncbi:MAG: isovaleryl-CoA dehydrogenase [bacterium]|nr:isovaleryl-CoA dehydrogenase [bacterium]